MSFVKKAKDFIDDQGSLTDHKYAKPMIETVRYLTKNAVGLKNAKSTNMIINYLEGKNLPIQRSEWEIHVLGTLRDHGIFIGSHRNKGMYIISSEAEAKKVYLSYKRRIFKEMDRMELLRAIMINEGWDTKV
jgi:hypothetical protein